MTTSRHLLSLGNLIAVYTDQAWTEFSAKILQNAKEQGIHIKGNCEWGHMLRNPSNLRNSPKMPPFEEGNWERSIHR